MILLNLFSIVASHSISPLSLSRDTNHEKILKGYLENFPTENIYVCVCVYYEVQSFFDNSIEGYYLFFPNY